MIALIASSASASNMTDFSTLYKVIQVEMKETKTPECAVAVVSDNKIVYAKGFGVASVEAGQPVTPDTLFLIGSTVKQFTAYTVLSMAGEGKLDINKPVGMNNTTFYVEMAVTHPMAMGHIGNASGKVTVVLDMARYAKAMMNNGTLDGRQVLSSKIIKEMCTPHADMAEGNVSYGYGLEMHSYRGVDVVEKLYFIPLLASDSPPVCSAWPPPLTAKLLSHLRKP